MINLKQLASVLAIISVISGGAWAVDARMDAKVTHELAPIKDDVRAIRNLLEKFLLQQIERRDRDGGIHAPGS